MLIKIAWRNIWRNKRRSIIVLISIIIGTVSIIFLDYYMAGTLNQMLDNQINSHISFIQLHKRGYNNNKIIQNYIPEISFVDSILRTNTNIKNYSKRAICFGLLSSPSNSSGINIVGIEPESEKQVTNIYQQMIEGNYLTGKKHEIILGKKMAEKLEVGLGDKVIIMAAAFDGKVSSDMFRVTGIFQTASSEFDKFFVFTNIKQAQELLGLGNKITEIAICLNDRSLVDSTKNSVLSSLGEPYEVLSYKDLLPNLIALLDTASSLMLAIYIIIGIAMIFGIINTKLMSVFERIREFGILMANGMKNSQIFRMIILEAFFLGSIGIIIGIIISIIIYLPLSKYGIDLSTFAESLSSLGISAIIYPELKVTSLITASVVILLTTILGALYPAIKAIRFEPVKAIRYI